MGAVDPPHGWNDTHAAWNGGRYDAWVPNKGVTAMTHHTREDLPYQFALTDAFTVCDKLPLLAQGPTDPNRYHGVPLRRPPRRRPRQHQRPRHGRAAVNRRARLERFAATVSWR